MGNTGRKKRNATQKKNVSRHRKSPSLNQRSASEEILDKAQILLQEGDNSAAKKAVEGLISAGTLDESSEDYVTALRIAAFASANLREFELARDFALRALKADETLLDFNYLLSYVYGMLDEHALVCDFGSRYIEKYRTINSNEGSGHAFAGTYGNAHEVLNGVGVSLCELGKLQDAVNHFEQAIRLKPDFVVTYINLARLAEHNAQHGDAIKILERGIAACPDSQELKMLRDAIQTSRPTVSLCMIVKNEEKMLPRALKSVQGVVDEIIVVDTGSDDNTVEIAESFGATVYHHEWERDFSKARNQSLSYATKEWIFVLDADEELIREDIPLLRDMLQQTSNNLISVSVFNVSDDEEHASFLPSVRFFRRSIGAYYDGIVHNQLKFDEKKHVVLRGGVRIKHYGYGLSKEAMKKKVERSRELLIKQLEEDPNDPFANMNMAQLYRGESATPSGEICDKIILHAQRVVDNTDPTSVDRRHLHLMALHQLASAYFFKSDFARARELCLKALEFKPDYLDPLITLGYICTQTQDWVEARDWYGRYLRERERFDDANETQAIILLNYKSEHNALYGIAQAYEQEGNSEQAIRWYEKVQEMQQCYLDSALRLAQLYFNCEDYESAMLHASSHLRRNPKAWPAHFIIGESCRIQGRASDSEKYLKQAEKMQPDNMDILYSLLKLYFATDRASEASQIADRIESEFPDFTHPFRMMADVKFAAGQYENAVRLYEKCSGEAGQDAQLWNNLGNSFFKLDQYQKAEQCYRHALTIEPDMALANRNLGVCLVQSGKRGEAAEILSTCLELAPDDFPVAHLLGDIMFEAGHLNAALKMYELCVTLAPDSYVVITKLADVYLKQGHIDSARLGYRQALGINPNHEPARLGLEALEEETAKRG